MTDQKKSTETTETTRTTKTTAGDDAGQAEVQAKSDEAEAKGYLGTVPPGPPNEAFSLESGPDSPSAYEQSVASAAARGAELKESSSDA